MAILSLYSLPNDFKAYFDWASGCIAVTDEEIEEIYNLIDVPTKIHIQP